MNFRSDSIVFPDPFYLFYIRILFVNILFFQIYFLNICLAKDIGVMLLFHVYSYRNAYTFLVCRRRNICVRVTILRWGGFLYIFSAIYFFTDRTPFLIWGESGRDFEMQLWCVFKYVPWRIRIALLCTPNHSKSDGSFAFAEFRGLFLYYGVR